ncbi:MAG: hypothetical protein LBQ46_12920 [Treponema sp.]|jgi:hypothetical protein|nr:hypothetical protein [Treponema sp.]
MLYPKREQPFREEDFQNPSSEYRAAPFWAWNNKLSPEELCWQIEQLKKLGFGGFHMHVRTGLATEYLSDAYMAAVRACVEKARQEGMLAWLYDEDRWPSGAAGGLVTRQERYRMRRLLLTRHPYGQGASSPRPDWYSPDRSENGSLAACFDVVLNGRGELERYRAIGEDAPAQGIKLYAYVETSAPSPWYNNQTYVNTLDGEAIGEFIRITYERYGRDFAEEFGGLIPAIFTDEPQFSRKGTLHFAREDRDVTLPWTSGLEESFKLKYGESLTGGLPELLWELPNGAVSAIRYHYHDQVIERFSSAFADQCGRWCEEHKLMLTGHMMEEPSLESQTAAIGEAMRSYRSFQLPGIDMLCDRREFTTAKQAASAARQYGRPGVLSELYGVTNWDFDFRGHKLQGDWQAALGVTVRVPHLSWVSMNGEAKRDYPGSFNYQAPWFREYPYVEDHFARVALIMTRGRARTRVGVLHPIEIYWLHWGPRESTQAIREQMDTDFQDLCQWLLRGCIDFDYICESTLPDLCPALRAEDYGKEPRFPVGRMGYEVLIVPGMETIRQSTLDRLAAFAQAGGRIIFLGTAPRYLDARPSGEAEKLARKCETLGFERLPLLAALEPVRDLSLRDGSGAETGGLIYQMREEGPLRWLFIAHADTPENPDIPQELALRIRIRGRWEVSLCDTVKAGIRPLAARWEEGDTLLSYPLYDHDSLLLKLEPAKFAEPVQSGETAESGAPAAEGPAIRQAAEGPAIRPAARQTVFFPGPVPVQLHEPNVLLLDLAEFALDDGAYRPREEVLRLDNRLREELGWPQRKKEVAQPWVEADGSTPHTLRLRYTFESELALDGTELALENAAITQVSLNGEKAGTAELWYVDKCIGRVKLPAIKPGLNTLELAIPYGRKIDVEAAYLLGDFGVTVRGVCAALTAPVRTLAFGDITRQGLPFYGGNLSYYLELPAGASEIAVSCYRGQLLKLRDEAGDLGIIAYAPYRLPLEKAAGKNLEILYFGNRINTFGQLHCTIRDRGFWWGPGSWRTEGPAWTYEYHFWPQGILKSPEIY